MIENQQTLIISTDKIMKKIFFISELLFLNAFTLISQSYSYETIKNYRPFYYDDSIISRYEFLADSIFEKGTDYYDSCFSMIDLPFLKKPSLLNKYKIFNSSYKIFIDSNISPSDFSVNKFNATAILIFDNGGLDSMLDSLNYVIKGQDKHYYHLKCYYNDDSILERIVFTKFNNKSKMISRDIQKPVRSIKISYYPDGNLFCFVEKENNVVLRKYLYNDEESKLIYASNIVKLNRHYKRLNIDYYKSRILRLFTVDTIADLYDGLVLIGPKHYGKYDNIKVEKNGVIIYDEYNPRFSGGSVYVQSEFDKNTYFYYFFNVFRKIQAFSILHYTGDLEQVTKYQIKCGKIKKVYYFVRKYNKSVQRF